jgi:hypothetical protein
MISHKTYALIAGIVFSLVAAGHALRLVYEAPVHIAGWTVPMWVSWLGLPVAVFLGIAGLKLSRK